MRKVDQVLKLIGEIFGDTSVSREETIEQLEAIASEVETRLECLEDEDA